MCRKKLSIICKSISIIMLLAFFSLACLAQTGPNQSSLGSEYARAVSSSLVGQWSCQVGQEKIMLKFDSEGSCILNQKQGTYEINDNNLVLVIDNETSTYQLSLDKDNLTLSSSDIPTSMVFTKIKGSIVSTNQLSKNSLKSIYEKLHHILIIIFITIACRVVLWLIKVFGHFLIYSQLGPLKFLYRRHKKRTMTLYSLAINISKYIVYFLAFGFILTELGIHYTAYLASLSVIGLAIGFGSQGLVQDMVTGFFIVFEQQFNVGDMVEIPPHIGVVEQLGLRMTRLRNYLGQRLTIPNRNIAAVGNYIKGAQQVNIDIAISETADVDRVKKTLMEIVTEAQHQFLDIILSIPVQMELIKLADGARFIRFEMSIWPGQQWIIDQQVLTRIEKVFKEKKIEIPGDNIIVFYHPRQRFDHRLIQQ